MKSHGREEEEEKEEEEECLWTLRRRNEWHFRRTYCLLSLMMEAVGTSETSDNFYETTSQKTYVVFVLIFKCGCTEVTVNQSGGRIRIYFQNVLVLTHKDDRLSPEESW
jgi:hypothetical protein